MGACVYTVLIVSEPYFSKECGHQRGAVTTLLIAGLRCFLLSPLSWLGVASARLAAVPPAMWKTCNNHLHCGCFWMIPALVLIDINLYIGFARYNLAEAGYLASICSRTKTCGMFLTLLCQNPPYFLASSVLASPTQNTREYRMIPMYTRNHESNQHSDYCGDTGQVYLTKSLGPTVPWFPHIEPTTI